MHCQYLGQGVRVPVVRSTEQAHRRHRKPGQVRRILLACLGYSFRHSRQFTRDFTHAAVGLDVPGNLPQFIYVEDGDDEQSLAAQPGDVPRYHVPRA
jgi:hypothetical protein